MKFTPGFYTFDPFDAPVFVEAVESVTDTANPYDLVTTADAGAIKIYPGTFDLFAKPA